MTQGRSDTRAELSRLLLADAPPGDEASKAPDEIASAHLHELISQGIDGSLEDQRAVYEHLPLLMLRVFGYTAGTGWLETGSCLPHNHREALMDLVRPNGAVVEYCLARSPPLGSDPKEDEWRFEYPVANLPALLIDDFFDAAEQVMTHPYQFFSAMAPTIGRCLRKGVDGSPDVLLLSPIDYFYLCMIASPTQKWTQPQGSYMAGRRPRQKRSASLPSTRAMYNRVLAEHVAYAWRLSPHASGGGKSILIPACIDCLFAPLSGAMYNGLPEASTPTIDAMASVLLALRPGSPGDLLFSSGVVGGNVVQSSPAREPAIALLYASAHDALHSIFSLFPVGANGGPLPTLAACLRLLALYLAPVNAVVVNSLKSSLYPKVRPLKPSNGASPSLAVFQSTMSSLHAQFQAPAQALRNSASPSSTREDAVWKSSAVLLSRQEADRELLRLAVMKCATARMAGTQEGVRALTILANAVRASSIYTMEATRVEGLDEVRASLRGLSEQLADYDLRSGVKSKSFVPVLGSGLGIKIETGGMFSGVVDIVHSTAHRVSHVTGSGNGNVSRRLRDRRKAELHTACHDETVLLGSVWDRPIESREYEFLVVLAFHAASAFEARFGWELPQLRWIGRKKLLHATVAVFFLCSLLTRVPIF